METEMTIALLILCIGGTVALVTFRRKKTHDGDDPLFIVGTIATFFLVITLGAFALIMPLVTSSDARRLEVFHETNASVYMDASDIVREGILSVGQSNGSFIDPDGLKNLRQIEPFADSVVLARSEIVNFNLELRSHTYWHSTKVFWPLWRPVSNELTPLTLR